MSWIVGLLSGSGRGCYPGDFLHHGQCELFASSGVAYCTVVAYIGAVEAHYASRAVDHVVREVNTFAFASVDTFTALGTQVGVDVKLEYGVAAYKAQSGADGADGVAEQPASAGRYGDDYAYGSSGEQGCGEHGVGEYGFGLPCLKVLGEGAAEGRYFGAHC